ncbi:MAG: SpoIIE family protein phosphatase [Planctomycetia bacterium]|nr:SpoIIE family protein phosphatase [Planctomycetia bacterium]
MKKNKFFRRLLDRSFLLLTACFKTRNRLIVTIVLPSFLVTLSMLCLYTWNEYKKEVSLAKSELTSNTVQEAMRLRRLMNELVSALDDLNTLLDRQAFSEISVENLLQKTPCASIVGIAYDPVFLRKLQQGTYPEYSLRDMFNMTDEEVGSPAFSRFYFRAEEDTIQRETVTDAYFFQNWYQLSRLHRRGVWGGPTLTFINNLTACYYSVPFFVRGDFAGVMVIAFRMPVLFSELKQRMAGEAYRKEQTFLLSEEGQFLYSSVAEFSNKNAYALAAERDFVRLAPFFDLTLSGLTGSYSYSRDLLFTNRSWSRSVCHVCTPVELNSGYVLIKTFSMPDIMMSFYRRMISMWVWSLAGYLLLSLMIGILSFCVYSPIIAVSEASQKVANGNLNVFVPSKYEKMDNPMGSLAANFNGMVRDLKKYMSKEIAELAGYQALSRELEMAEDLQLSLMPGAEEAEQVTDLDLWAECIPVHYVAGDFYDFWQVDEDRLFFLIADVSGKGVPAAIFMSSARILVRVASRYELNPGRVMSLINTMICLNNKKTNFMTMFLGLYNTKTGELRYCNAGHPYPMVIAKDGKVRVLDGSTNLVIGVFNDAEYHTVTDLIEQDETLLIYTDGITESLSPTNEVYGSAHLRDECSLLSNASPKELVEKIIESAKLFSNNVTKDDITLLALCRKNRAETMLKPDSFRADELYQES